MTPQRVVSARAAASGLVIRRLESMQSHANRQVVHARVPQPSPARGQCRPHKEQARLHKARAGHWCASHAGTLLLREGGKKEKKKRSNGQMAGLFSLKSTICP